MLGFYEIKPKIEAVIFAWLQTLMSYDKADHAMEYCGFCFIPRSRDIELHTYTAEPSLLYVEDGKKEASRLQEHLRDVFADKICDHIYGMKLSKFLYVEEAQLDKKALQGLCRRAKETFHFKHFDPIKDEFVLEAF